MKSGAAVALLVVALLAVFTALAHLCCIFLGPSCYRAQLAPPVVVQASINGTLYAPVVTIIVSGLFLACAVFALYGADLIRKLPLLRAALLIIALICLVRGIATIPLLLRIPALNSPFALAAGLIWFIAGCLYLYGLLCVRQTRS